MCVYIYIYITRVCVCVSAHIPPRHDHQDFIATSLYHGGWSTLHWHITRICSFCSHCRSLQSANKKEMVATLDHWTDIHRFTWAVGAVSKEFTEFHLAINLQTHPTKLMHGFQCSMPQGHWNGEPLSLASQHVGKGIIVTHCVLLESYLKFKRIQEIWSFDPWIERRLGISLVWRVDHN